MDLYYLLRDQYQLDSKIDRSYIEIALCNSNNKENVIFKYSFTSKIKNTILALQSELQELLDCFSWKPWRKQQKTDIENVKKEWIDCLHFLLSLANTIGLSEKEIFEMYNEKHKINLERQSEGY